MSAEMHPLAVVSRRSRRRKRVGQVAEALATLAAVLAVALLAVVIVSVAKRGGGALSWDFFTKTPVPFGQTGGGIENSIIGSLVLTGMATAISVPVGVLIAIYNTEFAPARVSELIQLVMNVLAGVPTIVIGFFIFGLLVAGSGQSAIAGSVALSIVMLPIVARSTEEVLRLVPPTLREGGMALGATRARTVVTILLPTAVGGIVTATILAVARAAGETAPLLFTSSIAANTVTTDIHQAMSSLPFAIFTGSESASPQDQQQAWAAALVLMAVVLIGGVVGRLLSLRTRRQIEQAR